MEIKIECIHCRECFTTEDIEYATETIPKGLDEDDLREFAEESEVRFDCPECEEVQYLSDCEIF